jgi:cellobiose-specific phosphotransferase system component IIC
MLTLVAGLAFLVYFMIGALNWVTAGGDKGKVDTAKMYMTNGAIGMITIVAAYAVIWIVGQVLGLEILNPADSSLFGGNGSNSSAASQSQNLPINNQLGGPQE